MNKIRIMSMARDMVGNLATIRAEIMEDAGGYLRVKDTIELEVEGGARMNDAELEAIVKAQYNG